MLCTVEEGPQVLLARLGVWCPSGLPGPAVLTAVASQAAACCLAAGLAAVPLLEPWPSGAPLAVVWMCSQFQPTCNLCLTPY